MHFQTKLLHSGIEPDSATGAISTPIYQTTTFAWNDAETNKGFDYSRTGNPTRKVLEDNLAALEGGQFGIALPTGMAAETTVLSLFKTGDHIICGNDVYGGTVRLMNFISKQYNIEVTFVSMNDLGNIERSIKNNTRAVWLESPSNPLLNLVDIEAAAEIAHKNGALLIVDNTFLSPYFQQPLSLGADIIVHSTTKYLSGHNDGLGGAIVSDDPELHERLAYSANALGCAQGAFDAWLVLRGIKTLAVRMKEHEKNAQKIAEYLVDHPAVETVNYPGIDNHPQAALIKKQMTGYGGMLSFEVKGGKEKARTILQNTKLFYIAESFGGVESLISYPMTHSHGSMSSEEHEAAGIKDGLIRVSVGIEDVNDLIEDLGRALDA
ncbi:trans-sulfuration enzyme family protein [candidate division KSB1 bacterium]